MEQTQIFVPVMALIGWTLLVILLIPYRRLRAGFAGKITPDDFKFGESARVPGEALIPNRHYMNLLEAPLLFYVLCLIMFVTGHVDRTALTLTWLYVGTRLLHSLIHLGYNHVLHRLAVFATSTALLTLLWARLAWQLL